jgi:hypothetical protein
LFFVRQSADLISLTFSGDSEMTLEKSDSETLKLVFCGGLFIASGTDKESLEEVARATGGRIRKYGVDISAFDPKTCKVTKWKMKEGFSVWKPLPKKEEGNFRGRRFLNKRF